MTTLPSQWFNAYDEGQKGFLDRPNVKTLMEGMGFGPDDAYVGKLFQKISDDDNKITPREFESLFQLLGSPTHPPPKPPAAAAWVAARQGLAAAAAR